jgi:hypothetical protein
MDASKPMMEFPMQNSPVAPPPLAGVRAYIPTVISRRQCRTIDFLSGSDWVKINFPMLGNFADLNLQGQSKRLGVSALPYS